MGPDREITVRVYESILKEVQKSAQVDEGLKCKLDIDVQVEGGADEWDISLSKEDGTVIKKVRAQGKVEWNVDADLWWPVGEGLPTRYTVQIDLLDKVRLTLFIVRVKADDRTALLSRKIGFRRVELV
jgi:hypothetical protein